MSQDETKNIMGDPSSIRAAKLYTDSGQTMVWEYLPPQAGLYAKTYWLYFDNGRLVQWGEPGDFQSKSEKHS